MALALDWQHVCASMQRNSPGNKVSIVALRCKPVSADVVLGKEAAMSVEFVLEMRNRESARSVVNALDAYKSKLRASIQRTRRNLKVFEQRYGVTTAFFLHEMAAEDLAGGDVEYVEWAGEAGLLDGLETELKELEDVRYQVH
jgi:hypothetical protein